MIQLLKVKAYSEWRDNPVKQIKGDHLVWVSERSSTDCLLSHYMCTRNKDEKKMET